MVGKKNSKNFGYISHPIRNFIGWLFFSRLPGGRQPHFPPLYIPCRSADQQRTAEIKGCLHFEHHTCVPSFPLVWSYLEMTRLGEPTLFPFEESLRKERLWLNVSCLIRKCHGLKYTNISSSLLLKSNERVHLGCFKSDTLWRKKLQCQYNPLQGIYKPYPKEFFS